MKGDGNPQTTTLNTVKQHEERIIALRLVPVILKHGKKRLKVNCILDEGSDTRYVNEDLVEAFRNSSNQRRDHH